MDELKRLFESMPEALEKELLKERIQELETQLAAKSKKDLDPVAEKNEMFAMMRWMEEGPGRKIIDDSFALRAAFERDKDALLKLYAEKARLMRRSHEPIIQEFQKRFGTKFDLGIRPLNGEDDD